MFWVRNAKETSSSEACRLMRQHLATQSLHLMYWLDAPATGETLLSVPMEEIAMFVLAEGLLSTSGDKA